jgi:acetolactate synthase I/II/III large subunit
MQTAETTLPAPPPPTSDTETLSGAQVVVRLLERQGVDTIAGIPGGAILPLYDALAQSGRLRHILARHEQGAGFIAQGMARISGRPAVCLASSGPGATNLLTAIADAKLDSVPLIAITGQVPQALIGTDAFQEVDAIGLSHTITKHSFQARSASELLEIIPAAFSIAASGRPGPVLIDIPKDVQSEMLTITHWPQPGEPEPAAAADAQAIARAAAMINAAKAPVLYLGGGIIHAGACGQAVALAEKAGLPTTTTLMALGAMPACHPLAIGMLGMHGARHTNLVLDESDLLIAVGARFDDRATGRLEAFCPRAKVIHIDIDAAELGKLKTPHVAIRGDASAVLSRLLPLVEPNERNDWLARVDGLRQSFPPQWLDIDDARSHYGLVRAVADCLQEDAVITTDVGQHQMWVAQAYPFAESRRWLSSGGLGTMGFGIPAALGAAMAEPGRTVVCFTGDGSILMNLQELATLAESGANVKIVLMNNGALGLVQQQQELFYGERTYASRYAAPPDFVAIARGFGLKAADLDTADDPRALLRRLLTKPGPCLIHASIDRQAKAFPMVPPGAANTQMIGA